eukprot:SM000177S03162  [mRNA]  locus=s177:17779:18714:+ [translate_table: standard]
MDGNLVDAAAIAIKGALANTRLPKVEVSGGGDGSDDPVEVEVSDDPEDSGTRLDTVHVPLAVTMTQVGQHYLVDTTAEEEAQLGQSSLTISVDHSGSICGMTKQGPAALKTDAVLEMLGIAKRLGPKLLASIDASIALGENEEG